mgnify:CR=1 FL=1
MVDEKLDIKNILNELKLGLQATYGNNLKHLFLYGSHARGEATPDSDIDVLMVLEKSNNVWEEIKCNSQFVSEICLKHNVVISLIPIKEIKYNTLRTTLIINVKREGIPL